MELLSKDLHSSEESRRERTHVVLAGSILGVARSCVPTATCVTLHFVYRVVNDDSRRGHHHDTVACTVAAIEHLFTRRKPSTSI